MDAYYFGCIDEIGHRLIDSEGESYAVNYIDRRLAASGFPLGHPESLDGGLFPPGDVYSREQGLTHRAVINGWTIISMADYTVDSRPGSVSVFLLRGEHTLDSAMLLASYYFPKITRRIGAIKVAL